MTRKKHGYGIYDYNGTGMLEVQKDDSSNMYEDDAAVAAAVKDGIRLIPVEELPEGFGRRYLGWIDTPENRERIAKYCEECNRYIVRASCDRDGDQILAGPLQPADVGSALKDAVLGWLRSDAAYPGMNAETAEKLWAAASKPGGAAYGLCSIVRYEDGPVCIRRGLGEYDDRFTVVKYTEAKR